MRVLRTLIMLVAVLVIALVRVGPEAAADEIYSTHAALPAAIAVAHANTLIETAAHAFQPVKGEHICHSGKRFEPEALALALAPRAAPHRLRVPPHQPDRLESASTDFPTPPPRPRLQA